MANNPPPYTRQAFAEWATNRSTHAVTLNADRELTERRMREIFGTFCHNADRLILRRRNVRNVPGDQRLFGIAYPENLGTNAHLHCAFDFAALVNLVGDGKSLEHKVELLWNAAAHRAGTVCVKPLTSAGWAYYASKSAHRHDPLYFLPADYHRS